MGDSLSAKVEALGKKFSDAAVKEKKRKPTRYNVYVGKCMREKKDIPKQQAMGECIALYRKDKLAGKLES